MEFPLTKTPDSPGEIILIDGEQWYKINNYDGLRPFLMSIVSDSDHWLFVSSLGGLTAGRQNAERALFPYITDDKLYDAHHHTGPMTVIHAPEIWEPFSDRYQGRYRLERNLYKHALGNQVRFEEINHDLGLLFSYAWQHSERFGFVRRVQLKNLRAARTVRMLDGLRNILPHGTTLAMQQQQSTLVDAYKRNELVGALGLYSLSSHPLDRPEPAEALGCSTVWFAGPEPHAHLLCDRQIRAFRQNLPLCSEHDIRAERGAHLVEIEASLPPEQSLTWMFVAELDQGILEVSALEDFLKGTYEDISREVADSVACGTKNLERIIGLSDGFQRSGLPLTNLRHTANTLFNVMRGGMPIDQYHIPGGDLARFVQTRNKTLDFSPADIRDVDDLQKSISSLVDSNLRRLCMEYLPLTFSRRHGDPSRPWNRFNINLHNEDGSRRLDYEGNWRDIFQNWEALALSYPSLTTAMICTFLNASTADGYNPYRISREGVDWEVPDPAIPWSHIGYWGDHQTVYLHRLLRIARSHFPKQLPSLLSDRLFTYANVPYRIKSYRDIVNDPHNTITFDWALERTIGDRVDIVGSDGRFIFTEDGEIYLVNLAEKLIVSFCARLSNFIPDAGIWMNTQRPEWNDANNALVGYGVSMVTLYQLRPFLSFCSELFSECYCTSVDVSAEVADWLESLGAALSSGVRGQQLMDALGEAGSNYRLNLYEAGFSGSHRSVSFTFLLSFVNNAISHIDDTIDSGRREDALYHAYNLMSVNGSGVLEIEHLPLMLEGQAAVLSSECIDAPEAIRLLQALRGSALWREDQHSFILYPDRQLSAFKDKATIDKALVKQSALLQELIAEGNYSIACRTPDGNYHFNSSFRNKSCLGSVLDSLSTNGHSEAVSEERGLILGMFESVFNHKAFTGRSGSFFKYEGLGSIYWHMVSKLLLSIQEVFFRSLDQGEKSTVLKELGALYYDLRKGIGDYKTPSVNGTFPSDPYSHTPAHAGAQQPGMTGQVKEDIIGRWNELGVRVKNGKLRFSGALLRSTEFLTEPDSLRCYTVDGTSTTLSLPAGTLGFTYAQIPVVYHKSDEYCIRIHDVSGATREQSELILSAEDSLGIFERSGKISRLDVFLAPMM